AAACTAGCWRGWFAIRRCPRSSSRSSRPSSAWPGWCPMNDVAAYVQLLVPMLWLGMVLAISFLEAPLKFGAPGVTLPIGLGIGRRVFKALNGVEVVLAAVLLAATLVARPSTAVLILVLVAAAVLAVQVIFVRPPLT